MLLERLLWMAVLADGCELVSAARVDLFPKFSYLAIASSLGAVRGGRFHGTDIVISRDASAVSSDEIATTPDIAAQFADHGGAKVSKLDAFPG